MGGLRAAHFFASLRQFTMTASISRWTMTCRAKE
jgi:hypothetical protein